MDPYVKARLMETIEQWVEEAKVLGCTKMPDRLVLEMSRNGGGFVNITIRRDAILDTINFKR